MYPGVLLLSILLALSYCEYSDSQILAQQEQISIKRTACLVLSRYHSNTQKDSIEQVVSGLPIQQQQKYINKMYAVAIEHCLPMMELEQAQKFFDQNTEFSPSSMFYIFDSFDYGHISDVETLSQTQENLIQFMKNFDDEVLAKFDETEGRTHNSGEQEGEIEFFGLSSKDVPSFSQMGLIIIFIFMAGFGISYLLSKLDDGKKVKNPNRRSKSKSARKSA